MKLKSIKERTVEINNRINRFKQLKRKNLTILVSSLCSVILVLSAILIPIFVNNGDNGFDGVSLYAMYTEKKDRFNEVHSPLKSKTSNRLTSGENESEVTDLLSYLNHEDTLTLFEKNGLISDNVNACLTANYNNLEIIVAVEYYKNLTYSNLVKNLNYFQRYYSDYLFKSKIYNTDFKKYNNLMFVNLMSVYDIFVGEVIETELGFLSEETKTFIKLTSTEENIIIPEGIEVIAENAFYTEHLYTSERINKTVKTIVLPESLKVIENRAFKNCVNLEDINLPDTIEYIGGYAFSKDEYLNQLYEPKLEINKLPLNLNYVAEDAFNNTVNYINCKNGSLFIIDKWVVGVKGYVSNEITIPDGVIGISERLLFSYNSNKLFISDSVKYIGNRVLTNDSGYVGIFIAGTNEFKETWSKDCFKVYEILTNKIFIYYNYTQSDVSDFSKLQFSQGSTIPDKKYYNGTKDTIVIDKYVEFIMPQAFYYTNAKEFIVDEANKYFCSIDGVIYTKDLKTLVAYPNKKENTTFEIPETVDSISEFAFNNCVNLTSIYISDNINYVGCGAFYFWTTDQTIYIQSKIIPANWNNNWHISFKANLVYGYNK